MKKYSMKERSVKLATNSATTGQLGTPSNVLNRLPSTGIKDKIKTSCPVFYEAWRQTCESREID
jgi:hypothetical protein